ncbi:MAG: hypothetical protein RLN60_02550 [Phycisphaerales bacterium]
MKALKIVAVLLVVFIIAIVGIVVLVVSQVDTLAKHGIERGGTYAMGVETTVDSVDIGIFSGTFEMNGFRVANPEGYARPSFLDLGNATSHSRPALCRATSSPSRRST